MSGAQTEPDSDQSVRVTTFELLFDLVFVFAIGEVVGLVIASPGRLGLLHAAIVLPLAWLCWIEYAWLGNLGPADRGDLRAAVVVGMAGMFFLAVSVAQAFDSRASATAMVIALAVVQVTTVFTLVRRTTGDRSADVAGVVLLIVAVVLLAAGAATDGTSRPTWWVIGTLVLLARVSIRSRRRWDVRGPSHFTERFGLVVLIALGENLVETGTTASTDGLSPRLVAALGLVLVLTIALWWLYFDAFSAVAERVLQVADRDTRARLARDGFAYIHLLMVGGIVTAAAGMALLIDRLDASVESEGRWLLDLGLAAYLAAHVAFRVRTFRSIHPPRIVAIGVLALGAVALGALPPLVQLAWPTVVIAALLAYELLAYRDWRNDVRSEQTETPVAPMTRGHRHRE